MTPGDPVVEPTALSALSAFRLVDARAADAARADPVAHAVRAPIEAWDRAARAGETAFDNTAFWRQAIAALSVDNDTPSIVFDDGRMIDAARVWFILQYFGANAFVLNGGRAALQNLDDLRGAATAVRSSFRAWPGSGPVGLVDRAALKAELASGVVILDARTAAEYAGEDKRGNARGGHLPGARRLSHADLLQHGRLRPAKELKDLLSHAGFQRGEPIVTHCDGGGRAALAAAAAVRAGYADVRATTSASPTGRRTRAARSFRNSRGKHD
jgi:thiosulfate/3-mercaptopyruvate sulfurtransferase